MYYVNTKIINLETENESLKKTILLLNKKIDELNYQMAFLKR
jgi:hypothetical protein